MNPAVEACQRGAGWILARLEPEGSLRGASDLSAYYKTPAALLWSDHQAEAAQVLGYVRRKFLLVSGDLNGAGVPWFSRYRIYPHAWLAYAAGDCGDADLQKQLIAYLRTQWNPDSGGFRARADGCEEIMTTCMAGLACLNAGEAALAAGVAHWLDRLWSAQPDIAKALYHVWRPGEGPVRGDGSVAYIVDTSKPRQWYFQYGISAAFLAEYARVTGDGAPLQLARRYLAASAHCASDVHRTPQSGKIGWGAAWTYRLSGDAEHAALVDAVAGWLFAVQCGDGSWNAEGVYETKPSTQEPSRFDVTAEFVALLAQMGAIARV